VRALLQSGGTLQAEQRLPLLDLAFPALKRRPPEFVMQLLETVKALIDTDGRVEVFEFLLRVSSPTPVSHRIRGRAPAGGRTLAAVATSAWR
jgi:hypothetical protein